MAELTIERIDNIMSETIFAVQRGKEQIFQFGDLAREEYLRLQAELELIRTEAAALSVRTEELDRKATICRSRLAEVSSGFGRHSEDDIRQAYEMAQEAQVQLAMAKQLEQDLRARREAVDKGLRRVEEMVSKSEDLVSSVTLAMELLTGKLNGISHHIEGLQAKSAVASQVIQAQEEERRRMARDIHDGPAQAMANIVLRTEICEKIMSTGKGNLATEFSELKRMTKDCLREVRRIIFNLRPMTLDDLGLLPTISRYVEELKTQTGLSLALAVSGREERLDPSLEAALFRIVQEALSNIAKYAKPKGAVVSLEFSPELIRLQVVDDGVGFDPAKTLKELMGKDHFGLLSMRERVELLKGRFQLASAPGKGTRVTVEIPLEKGANLVGGK